MCTMDFLSQFGLSADFSGINDKDTYKKRERVFEPIVNKPTDKIIPSSWIRNDNELHCTLEHVTDYQRGKIWFSVERFGKFGKLIFDKNKKIIFISFTSLLDFKDKFHDAFSQDLGISNIHAVSIVPGIDGACCDDSIDGDHEVHKPSAVEQVVPNCLLCYDGTSCNHRSIDCGVTHIEDDDLTIEPSDYVIAAESLAIFRWNKGRLYFRSANKWLSLDSIEGEGMKDGFYTINRDNFRND